MAKKIKVGLKSRSEKIRLFSSPYDSPLDEFGDFKISLTSNRKVILDGCKGVVDYDKQYICLNLGKKSVSFFGDEMEIVDFVDNQITFIGNLFRIEFGD